MLNSTIMPSSKIEEPKINGKALVLELMEVADSVKKSRNYNLGECLDKFKYIVNQINMVEGGSYVSNATTVYTRKVDMLEDEVMNLFGNVNATVLEMATDDTVVKPTRRRRSTIAQSSQVNGELRCVNFIPKKFEVVPKKTIMESYKKWDKNGYNDIHKNDTNISQRKKVPKKYHRINLIQNNNRVHLENGNLDIIDDNGSVHHRQNYNVFMKYIDDMDNSIKTEQEYYKSLKFIQSQKESNANKKDDKISTDQRKDTINTKLTVKPFRTFLSTSEIYKKCNLVIPKTEYGNLMKFNAKINELLLLSDDELLKYECGNEINKIMFENNGDTYKINEIANSVNNVVPDVTLNTVEQVNNSTEIIEPANSVDNIEPDVTQKTVEEVNNTSKTVEEVNNTTETIEPANIVNSVATNVVIETIEQVQHIAETIEPTDTADCVQRDIMDKTIEQVQNTVETIEPINSIESIDSVNTTEAIEPLTPIQTNELVHNTAENIEPVCTSETISNINSSGTTNSMNKNNQSVNIISNNNLISNVDNKINRANKKKREPDGTSQNIAIKKKRHNTDNINILDTIKLPYYKSDICIVSFPIPVYLSEFELVDWLNVSPMVLICNHSSNKKSKLNPRNCIVKFCADDKLNFIGNDFLGVYSNMNRRIMFSLPEEYDALKLARIEQCTDSDETMSQDEIELEFSGFENTTETITLENCTTNNTSVCENLENNTPTIITTTDFQENTELNDSTIANNTTISTDNLENTELNDSTIVNNTTISTDNLENTELNDSTIVNNTTISTDNLENAELKNSTIVSNTTLSTDNLENTQLNDSTIVINTTISTDNLENTELNDSTIVNNTTISTDNLENTELNDSTIVNNTTISTDNLENAELKNSTIVSNNTSISSDNLENTGLDNSAIELVENSTTITTDNLENTELDNSAVENGGNGEQTDKIALSTDLTNTKENISSHKSGSGRTVYDYFSQFSFINNNLNVYDGAIDSAGNVNEIAKLLLKDLIKQKSQKFTFHDFVIKHSDVSLPMCFFALLLLINSKNITILKPKNAAKRTSLDSIIITLLNSEFNAPDL